MHIPVTRRAPDLERPERVSDLPTVTELRGGPAWTWACGQASDFTVSKAPSHGVTRAPSITVLSL